MKKVEIIAPLPGIFYTKPDPNSKNFKQVGEHINIGDTICLIEVMKTFNNVASEFEGKLLSYEVKNEEPVTIGQVVAIIETK